MSSEPPEEQRGRGKIMVGGEFSMEARADIMADNQYYGIVKMIYMLLQSSRTKEEAEEKVSALMRESDRAEIKALVEKLNQRNEV